MPYIEECIESILSQSFQGWNLFILDNRSSDNTATLCSKYLSDPRVHYLLNDTDIGMYGNLNKCLDLCETRYYAILSHDDLYSCYRAIEDSFAALESDPDICAVYSHVNWIDERSAIITTRKSSVTGKVDSDKVARQSVLRCRNLFGVPLLVRRSATNGKKYDAGLFHTADVEFSVAIGHGRSIVILDRPCFSIRFHSRNNTAHSYASILPQMREIARRHGMSLGWGDRMNMMIGSLRMCVGKYIFFMYLDHFRQSGPAGQAT